MAVHRVNISFPSQEIHKQMTTHARQHRKMSLSSLIVQLLLSDMEHVKGTDEVAKKIEDVERLLEEIKSQKK